MALPPCPRAVTGDRISASGTPQINQPLTTTALLWREVNEMTTRRPTTSFKFRGGTFHALVVKPETPIEAWLGDIDRLLHRSKGFFTGKSVVIDVTGLTLSK